MTVRELTSLTLCTDNAVLLSRTVFSSSINLSIIFFIHLFVVWSIKCQKWWKMMVKDQGDVLACLEIFHLLSWRTKESRNVHIGEAEIREFGHFVWKISQKDWSIIKIFGDWLNWLMDYWFNACMCVYEVTLYPVTCCLLWPTVCLQPCLSLSLSGLQRAKLFFLSLKGIRVIASKQLANA